MNIIEVPLDHKMFCEEFCCEVDSFIYDEFGIYFTGDKDDEFFAYVFFRKGISGTQIQLPHIKVGEKDDDILFYNIELNNGNTSGYRVFCNVNNETFINIGYNLAEMILRVVSYIMATPRDRVVKKKGTPKPKSDNQKKSTKQYENKVFLLDEIVEYVSENGLNQAKHTGNSIKCPCWTVRGHFRHYKSGKVIFVENYKKGKEREKAEPKDKTYTI